jgi:hypothetical protein
MLTAKLAVVFGSEKSSKKTLTFDDSEELEAVQKKLTKAVKKKASITETLVFNLTQTADGVLIANVQSGWNFMLPRNSEKSYNFPWSRIWGRDVNTASSASLEVDGDVVFAGSGQHCDVQEMVEAFSLLDSKIAPTAHI